MSELQLLSVFKKWIGTKLTNACTCEGMREKKEKYKKGDREGLSQPCHVITHEMRYYELLVIGVNEKQNCVIFEGWSYSNKARDRKKSYHGTVSVPLEGIVSTVHAEMVASVNLPNQNYNHLSFR